MEDDDDWYTISYPQVDLRFISEFRDVRILYGSKLGTPNWEEICLPLAWYCDPHSSYGHLVKNGYQKFLEVLYTLYTYIHRLLTLYWKRHYQLIGIVHPNMSKLIPPEIRSTGAESMVFMEVDLVDRKTNIKSWGDAKRGTWWNIRFVQYERNGIYPIQYCRCSRKWDEILREYWMGHCIKVLCIANTCPVGDSIGNR